jgi:hypothetical protein
MPDDSAKQRIEQGQWVDCWVCEDIFHRLRKTSRYCRLCGRGFCEGEHGICAAGKCTCVICIVRATDTPRKTDIADFGE